MNLYRKHAQGDTLKTGFTLSVDNIDEYLNYSIEMNDELTWLNQILTLEYKLSHLDEINDELYTESYIKRRLQKLKAGRNITDFDYIRSLRDSLDEVNNEINKVKPFVFDSVEGKKEEHHIKMSELDDKRQAIEEDINNYYGKKYKSLQSNLPKIYYMILDGCDITTVKSCFNQMKQVLLGKKTTRQAANNLMDESCAKYNLPSTIWDPIRKTR